MVRGIYVGIPVAAVLIIMVGRVVFTPNVVNIHQVPEKVPEQNCGPCVVRRHLAPEQTQEQTNSVWANEPRATEPNCTNDLKLLCAWSTDRLRTSVVTSMVFRKATGTAASSHERADFDRGELNKMYESADPRLLKVGIVKLNFPTDGNIHVIPMGGEPYFHRSLRDADMVLDGFLRGDHAPKPGQKWLDFGGSHGRVAQVMAAAYPETSWSVCDPIADTVKWAAAHLPAVSFTVMDQMPPMSGYRDSTFSGIYAISIWSHYSKVPALAWFEEMHRILEPGGLLWFSTHGFQAVNYATLEAAVLHPRREEMVKELYHSGHYYYPMFGAAGDWNSPDGEGGALWGFGAFTPEWLTKYVLNAPDHPWRMEYYGPGANENHQDVFVLSKKK